MGFVRKGWLVLWACVLGLGVSGLSGWAAPAWQPNPKFPSR